MNRWARRNPASGRRSRSSRGGQALAGLGETALIERIRRRVWRGVGVEVGIGDDCAVVRAGKTRWLLTTDALVEGVHFRAGWDRPEGLGARAFQVNASDVAAMGGVPRFALLALSLPPTCRADEIERLVRGFVGAARRWGCAVVGGNLTAARERTIVVTLIGEAVGRPLLRSGARPGHGLYVSGSLGGAARARELLLAGRRLGAREARPFLRPRARVELGQELSRRQLASAAIDLSDGLLRDLGHLCRASRVGAEIEAEALPFARSLRSLPPEERLRLALGGGEDYELLFTVPPAREANLAGLGTPVRRIGRILPGRGVRVIDARGRTVPSPTPGYDHFSAGARSG